MADIHATKDNIPRYGWQNLEKIFSCGDEAWAYAFSLTSTKDGKVLFCPPVKGVFACLKTQAGLLPHDKHGSKNRIQFFVPYKKNSMEPAWSKAVKWYSRSYTDTEAHAQILYNRDIQSSIRFHEKQIENLKSELICDNNGNPYRLAE